jgi:hypothetical protein
VTGRSRQFAAGDRISVLLDLDAGWVRFCRNGERCGPGFAAGSVTGPLVRAVEMIEVGTAVTALVGAEAPAGAGGEEEGREVREEELQEERHYDMSAFSHPHNTSHIKQEAGNKQPPLLINIKKDSF